jgi:hypothetical protein
MDFNDFSRKTLTIVKNGFVNRNNNSLTYDTNKYSSLTISNTLNYSLKVAEHKFGPTGTESTKTDLNTLCGAC